jgi:hypothetical protein
MGESAKKMGDVRPFPVHTLDSYSLAAETLEAAIWNLVIDEIDADFPTAWAIGILDRLKIEIRELDYEE